MFVRIDLSFLQTKWIKLHSGTGEMQLGDSVPVQLMHKDKTGSLEEVSARRVSLSTLSVGVVECAVSKELPDFILEPVDNSPPEVLPSLNLGNQVNFVLST